MNSIGNFFGEICKVLLPIPEEIYFGNQNSRIAICTLSSIDLLKDISNSDILENVALVGRLFSENKGIDSIVRFIISNKNIKYLILCGKEVWGHKAGHSLIKLYENGIDIDGRIINSQSPDPVLEVSKNEVEQFRNQITIIDKIGEKNISEILKIFDSIKS